MAQEEFSKCLQSSVIHVIPSIQEGQFFENKYSSAHCLFAMFTLFIEVIILNIFYFQRQSVFV